MVDHARVSDLAIRLYQTIAEADKPRDMLQWHASSLAECPRAQFFKRRCVPVLDKPSAAKIIRWEAGHSVEQAIRPHLKTLYPELKSNVRMSSKELDLTGEYDNYDPASKTIIEVKSVHDYAFIQRQNQVTLKELVGEINGKKVYVPMISPYLHHEIQNHAYVLLLNEKGKEVDRIDYIYISLSGRVVSYSTEVSPTILEGVKNRLETLRKAWEAKEPPECICEPNHALWGPVLQWCGYRTDNGCCDIKLLKGEEDVHTNS